MARHALSQSLRRKRDVTADAPVSARLDKWICDWTGVDAVLDMGDRFGRSRFPAGMVEMQRLFMKAARGQGLLSDR
jgi:hypothetical protein